MERSIDKKTFLQILERKPAMVRKLVNPSPAFLASCMGKNRRVINYIPVEWLTHDVLVKYLKEDNLNPGDLKNFTESERDKVTPEEIKSIYDAQPGVICYLSQATYEMWLEYVKSEHSFIDEADIPQQHCTEDLLVAFVTQKNNSFKNDSTWTDRIVDRAIDIKPEVINYVPLSLVTYDRVVRVFKKDPQMDLNTRAVPKGLWDQNLAELATAAGNNLDCIPDSLINLAMCERAVNFNAFIYKNVPTRFRTMDITAAALLKDISLKYQHKVIPRRFIGNKKFILTLAQKEAGAVTVPMAFVIQKNNSTSPWRKPCQGLLNYLAAAPGTIKQEFWDDILKVCPSAITVIPKSAQTDKMVKTFLENSTPAIIDQAMNWINLTKIKAEYAPFLVGCTSPVLQSIVERKMNPKTREQKSVKLPKIPVTSSMVKIDVSDIELRDLLKYS